MRPTRIHARLRAHFPPTLLALTLGLGLPGCAGGGSEPLNDIVGGSGGSDTAVAGETAENDDGGAGGSTAGGSNSVGSSGLGADPEVLDFAINQSTLSLTIFNESGGNPDYTLLPADTWLQLSRTAGTFVGSSISVQVTLNRGALPVGESTSSIVASLDDGRILTVPVSAFVPDPASLGALWISTTELDFGALGDSLAFHLRGVSTTGVSYTISSNQSWISVSPSAGESSGEADSVTVGVDRAQLAVGTHVGSVTVTADGGATATVAILATVVAGAPPGGGGSDPQSAIVLDTSLLDFGVNSQQMFFRIRNGGTGTLNFTIVAGDSWLSPSITGGSITTEELTVGLMSNRCVVRSAGTYETTVTVADGNGASAVLTARYTIAAPPDDATIAAWLAPLGELPKRHYSWGLAPERLDDPADPVLNEFVRITRGLSLDAAALTAAQADVAVKVCKSVNSAGGAKPANIALVLSPWWNGFWAGVPPWYAGPEEQAELDRIRSMLESAKLLLAQANANNGASIAMPVLLLDTEHWFAVGWPDPSWTDPWNAAITSKLNAMHAVCKDVFPGAAVEWFGRGTVNLWSPGNELGDTYSCDLYNQANPDVNQLIHDRTYARVLGLNGNSTGFVLNVWVSLGAGFYRSPELARMFYSCDYDHDPGFDWFTGALLNDPGFARTAIQQSEYAAVQNIQLFPGPFDDPRTPSWARHFVAYVQGATGVIYTP